MKKQENTLNNLWKYICKLEDKGYYNPESVTRKEIRKYHRLYNLWTKLYNKVNA